LAIARVFRSTWTDRRFLPVFVAPSQTIRTLGSLQTPPSQALVERRGIFLPGASSPEGRRTHALSLCLRLLARPAASESLLSSV
jgi:hypothetical protein